VKTALWKKNISDVLLPHHVFSDVALITLPCLGQLFSIAAKYNYRASKL
jgi:hypothetical protein